MAEARRFVLQIEHVQEHRLLKAKKALEEIIEMSGKNVQRADTWLLNKIKYELIRRRQHLLNEVPSPAEEVKADQKSVWKPTWEIDTDVIPND